MGCGASSSENKNNNQGGPKKKDKPVAKTAEQDDDGKTNVRWKVVPTASQARDKYEADGTLQKSCDVGQLEFRHLLEEPMAQNRILNFAKQVKAQEAFMCWIDVQEFKSIPTDDYRRSKGLHIFHKYIKAGAVLQIGGLDADEVAEMKAILDRSKDDSKLIQLDFLNKIQMHCFTEVYENVFKRFKTSPQYIELERDIKKSVNRVRLEDFDYLDKLGEGGFGLVVHCRKQSTGKHYAMKIQTKKGLLECFADDPTRVTYEMNAFVKCQHPFIVNMDYSFQTDTLGVMVLSLATAGDLEHAISQCPDNRLSETRVQFYVAEIVLALSHLHALGFMYRDMKPNNILLNADGHVQLADLGGVIDSRGKSILGGTDYIPLFSPTVEENSVHQNARRMSIMGTFGYMAPEMVALMNENDDVSDGYTTTIDWWSMGATMFKMLTGSKPFDVEHAINTFFELKTSFFKPDKSNGYADEYLQLFKEINIPPYMSPAAADCVKAFLNVKEPERLGSGPDGLKNIKSHPFFAGIDWDKLEHKHHIPPFIPKVGKLKERPVYHDFDAMMDALHKKNWTEGRLSHDEQKHFNSWDYICPSTIKMEFGIANEIEQYESNFKIRHVLG